MISEKLVDAIAKKSRKFFAITVQKVDAKSGPHYLDLLLNRGITEASLPFLNGESPLLPAEITQEFRRAQWKVLAAVFSDNTGMSHL